jgi:serine O-acetyltransferase
VIGGAVVLGAGSKVLSGRNVGEGAKVGANCVVVEDVPANATVVLPKPRIILKEYEAP